jgi:RraA family protein
MFGKRILGAAPQADGRLIAAFATTPTALVSDNLERLHGSVGLRAFHAFRGPMVGTAFTVRVAEGDNFSIHHALDLIRPGDVLVVDGGGSLHRALVGEIMINLALSRGVVGMVIDGAIRDTGAIAAMEFPVFARGTTHRGPYKNGPGEINVPVSIGGQVITPGDIVIGDLDGLVSFDPEIADDLLQRVKAQEEKEKDILVSIAEGRYKGGYIK